MSTKRCPECGQSNRVEPERCQRCGVHLALGAGGQGLVGQLVGPYRLESVRRFTSSGTAFSASEEATGRWAEVKVIALTGVDSALRERRRREVNRRLGHPHLVRVLSSGEAGDWAYVATDALPEEESLAQRVAARGAIPPDQAFRMAHSLCDALCYLHGRGVIHRGLSPDSVLVHSESGSVRLADHGLSQAFSHGGGQDRSVTASSEVLGDPAYVAPEGLTQDLGPAGDLYALGATLAFALTGQPAFDSALEGRSPVQFGGGLGATLSAEARELVASLTAHDPTDRPKDARAALVLLSELTGLAAGADSRPPASATGTRSGSRRRIYLEHYEEQPDSSPIASASFENLPLPLARALAEAINARPGLPRRMIVFLLWEGLSRYLVALGVSLLREAGLPPPPRLAKNPLRLSFGAWVGLARETLDALADLAQTDDLARVLRDAFLAAPPGASKKESLEAYLGHLIALRNDTAHVWPEDEDADLLSRFVAFTEGAELLQRGRLMTLADARSEGDLVRYEPYVLQGLGPVRGRAFVARAGLVVDRLYYRRDDAPRFLELDPLVVWEQGEVLLLQKVERKRPRYDSLSRHVPRVLKERWEEVRELQEEAGAKGSQDSVIAAAAPVGERELDTPARKDSQIGRLLGGNYRIAAKIGEGGMGVVYRGWDLRLRRAVALKLQTGLGSAEARRRFATETRALAGLGNPQVVRIYDVGEERGAAFYAMELLQGETLGQWIRAQAPDGKEDSRLRAIASVSAEQLRSRVRWGRDVARALEEAHQKGIVHRDLKPANLIFAERATGETDHRSLKIVDFGLAKVEGEDPTVTRAQLGTPRYMSPEQAFDSKRVGPATDVYGLGLVLYSLLSLSKPFHDVSEGPDSVFYERARTGKLARLRERCPGLPDELDTITHKALAPEQAGRYRSAAALADDLERWLDGLPIEARPAGPIERATKWMRREPLKAALGGVLVASVLGVSTLAATALAQWSAASEALDGERAAAAEARAAQARLREALAGAKIQTLRVELGVIQTAAVKLQTSEPAEANALTAAEQLERLETLRERHAELAASLRAGDRREPAPTVRGEEGDSVEELTALAELEDDLRGQLEAEISRQLQTYETTRGSAPVFGLPADVGAVAFGPDGKRALVGLGGYLVEYELRTGRPVRFFEGVGGSIHACAFRPDGSQVLAASSDETLRLWDRASGRLVRTFEGHERRISACAFSPDGSQILSASYDATVRLWDRASGRLVRTYEGHDDLRPIGACAFSPDGTLILSASEKAVHLWERASGRLVRAFEGRRGWIQTCAFSPDGSQVVSGSTQGTLHLWDRVSGMPLAILEPGEEEGTVYACAFSPDGSQIVSASDKTLHLWDSASGSLVRSYEGHGSSVKSCAFSPDGSQILSTSDKAARLWSASGTGGLLRSLDLGWDYTACASSPDGNLVLSSSVDGTLRLWDRGSARLLRTFEGHRGAVFACAFSPDGSQILSASADGTLRLWKRTSGRLVRTFEGHGGSVRSCAFSPDGSQVLSASDDRTLRLWNPSTGSTLAVFEGHHGSVRACAFSPDGSQILSASEDRTLRLWSCDALPPPLDEDGSRLQRLRSELGSPAVGVLVHTFEGHEGYVLACAFSPDGSEILSASADGTARLWGCNPEALGRASVVGDRDGRPVLGRPPTGRRVHTLLQEPQGAVLACAFSPDGSQVLTGAEAWGSLRLWDRRSRQLLRSFEGHRGSVVGCAFGPDGNALLSVSSDGTLRSWDNDSGRPLRTFDSPPNEWMRITACTFSADGSQIVSADLLGDLGLWNRATGALVQTFEGHDGFVLACAFSPDGRQILSPSEDGTLRLWDRATGALVRTFEGHAATVYSCAFSPDGNQVLSASADNTFRLWGRRSGRLVRTIVEPTLVQPEHELGVTCAVFSPDGSQILSASEAGLRLWDRASGQLLGAFEAATADSDFRVTTCAFSRDGRQILAGSKGGTVHLWERASGRLVRTFKREDGGDILACTFSADGRLILAVDEFKACLWERASGRLVRTFPAMSAALSPDGTELVVSGHGDPLRVYATPRGWSASRWLESGPPSRERLARRLLRVRLLGRPEAPSPDSFPRLVERE